MRLIVTFSCIRSAVQSSPARLICPAPRCFFVGAIGTKYVLRRRPSAIVFVIPSSSNRKWRVGSANGELRIGFWIETLGTPHPLRQRRLGAVRIPVTGHRQSAAPPIEPRSGLE